MAKAKSYSLLCPIARALDAVGDRWSLLILRDLHAGPARFADLQSGLTGIASNLLSDRLVHLASEGLIEKAQGPHGTALYQLTRAGMGTRGLLFELARFGGHLAPVPDPKEPGNLRTVAVTLAAALDRVVTPGTRGQAELTVDAEPFAISISDGAVSVTAGENPDADMRITTSYTALLSLARGAMTMAEFANSAATISASSPDASDAMLALMAAAMTQLQ